MSSSGWEQRSFLGSQGGRETTVVMGCKTEQGEITVVTECKTYRGETTVVMKYKTHRGNGA